MAMKYSRLIQTRKRGLDYISKLSYSLPVGSSCFEIRMAVFGNGLNLRKWTDIIADLIDM